MSTAEAATPILPKGFIRPCLLLLLREDPAHGYDLLERLGSFGFDRSDPGGLYRALRSLEKESLVRSVWESSSAGPDRRIYELTRAGMGELHRNALALTRTDDLLRIFLSRYSEFVSLPPRETASVPSAPMTPSAARA